MPPGCSHSRQIQGVNDGQLLLLAVPVVSLSQADCLDLKAALLDSSLDEVDRGRFADGLCHLLQVSTSARVL